MPVPYAASRQDVKINLGYIASRSVSYLKRAMFHISPILLATYTQPEPTVFDAVMRTYLACWQGNFGLVAFRGYLIRKLVSPAFETVRPGHFTWLSFVASSLLFGALHGRWLAGTLAGMAYAAALYRRGPV